MGVPGVIQSKSATAVCDVILQCMYAYGPPKILQSGNGKEFYEASLSDVVEEMKQ